MCLWIRTQLQEEFEIFFWANRRKINKEWKPKKTVKNRLLQDDKNTASRQVKHTSYQQRRKISRIPIKQKTKKILLKWTPGIDRWDLGKTQILIELYHLCGNKLIFLFLSITIKLNKVRHIDNI